MKAGIATAAALAVTLTGCAMLPDSGPARRTVEAEATATLDESSGASILQYALVELNRYVLPLITDPGPGSLLRTFGAGHGPLPEIKVGVGDTVQVTLFEAQAGGLFIPTDAGSRPGNFVALPPQTVDSKGFITVPYAGQIRVLNRGTPAIQQEIVGEAERSRHRAAGGGVARQPDLDARRPWSATSTVRAGSRSILLATGCSTRSRAPAAFAIPATRSSSRCSGAA